jgi:uncharacterized protein YjbJ (UPF0337 family)
MGTNTDDGRTDVAAAKAKELFSDLQDKADDLADAAKDAVKHD